MAKDKRVTISIKLNPDRDKDLITWWQGLARGQSAVRGGKNQIALALLREVLFGEVVTPPQQENLIDENNHLRQIIDQHERDLHALHARIQALEARPVTVVVDSQQEIELTQNLSAKEKAVRKGKMLNNSW